MAERAIGAKSENMRLVGESPPDLSISGTVNVTANAGVIGDSGYLDITAWRIRGGSIRVSLYFPGVDTETLTRLAGAINTVTTGIASPLPDHVSPGPLGGARPTEAST